MAGKQKRLKGDVIGADDVADISESGEIPQRAKTMD